MSYPWGQNLYVLREFRVIDGDTIHASVDLGLGTHRSVKIRLFGFDAPELRRGTEADKQRGREAKAALESYLRSGTVLVQFQKGRSFDRWIGDLWVSDAAGTETSVRAWMISKGFST